MGTGRASDAPPSVEEVLARTSSDPDSAGFALPLRMQVPAESRIPLIRVAVATGAEEIRISGAAGAWIGRHRTGYRPSQIQAGEEWTLRPAGPGIEVRDGAGRRRATVPDTLFAFSADPESAPLSVRGAPYHGQILVWRAGDRLVAVNVIDLESYLRGVVPLEMGFLSPEAYEAVKAQAVAARSYTLATMGRWRHLGYDLVSTVEDQVYGGVAKEKAACNQAIHDTRGVVLAYDGSAIRAFYSSTCGGTTAGPDEVWGHKPVEYLKTVRDRTRRVDDSFCEGSPRFRWSEEWTLAAFETMLDQHLKRGEPGWSRAKYGALRGIAIRDRGESKRVAALRLEFEKGTIDLRGDEVRWAIRRPNGEGLRSALLTKVEFSKASKGRSKIRISGRGYGHGVGLCQFGAFGMSKTGYEYTQILRFYYRGARLGHIY